MLLESVKEAREFLAKYEKSIVVAGNPILHDPLSEKDMQLDAFQAWVSLALESKSPIALWFDHRWSINPYLLKWKWWWRKTQRYTLDELSLEIQDFYTPYLSKANLASKDVFCLFELHAAQNVTWKMQQLYWSFPNEKIDASYHTVTAYTSWGPQTTCEWITAWFLRIVAKRIDTSAQAILLCLSEEERTCQFKLMWGSIVANKIREIEWKTPIENRILYV